MRFNLQRLLSLLLFGLLQPCYVNAQSPGFWHLSDADGLPSNTIYHIAESPKGYLYLGTAAGVVKFNGFQFHTLKNNFAKAADASNLQFNSKGDLWFSNFNHELFKVDSNENISKMLNVNQTNFNAQGKFVIDKNNNTWFFNTSKLHSLEHGNQNLRSWELNFALFSYWTNGDKAYATGLEKLVQIQLENNQYNDHKNRTVLLDKGKKNEKPIIIYNSRIKFITSVNFNVIDKPDDLNILNLNEFSQIKSITNFGFLRDGKIWLATNNGFFVFDKDGVPLYHGDAILKGKNTSYVYLDSRNNYWVATLDEGLFMINNFDIKTWYFYRDENRLNGVASLFKDKDGLLIGTQNGEIYRYNGQLNKLIQSSDKGGVYFIGKVGDNDGYVINYSYYNQLKNIGRPLAELSAPRGMVLVGEDVIYSNNSGLRRALKSNLSGSKTQVKPVVLVLETRNEKNEILKSINTEITTHILFGRGGRLYEDENGIIWINSSSGIYNLNWKSKKLVKIELSNNPNAMAVDFASDGKGNMFIAVANDGIIQWSEKGVVAHYTVDNGLLSPNARRLLWAGNKLWVASAKGINVIETDIGKFHDFRITDGLISNDIQDIASYDHKIWVATFKGLNSIPENYISKNPNPPVLNLKSIKLNGIEMNSKLLRNGKYNFNEGTVEFLFEGIDFKSRNLLYYMYRLKGLDDRWIRLDGNSDHVAFHGLTAGEYIFELKAFNDKNISGNGALIIPFKIVEPFWHKRWFWIFVVFVLVLLSYLFIRKRQAENVKKVKLENALRLSQLASLKAQMNPHFMFNALNSIQDFILLNDKASANAYLGKFSDLMRLVLDMSNQAYFGLANELKAIHLYLELESLRFEDSFKYTIEVHDDLDVNDWMIPSMIIQPFIENAVKHGLLHKRTDRILSVHFALDADNSNLNVTIIDNGVGRKEAERINNAKGNRHVSFATGATQRRLQLLNTHKSDNIRIIYDDLTDATGNSIGTKVVLLIPLVSTQKYIHEIAQFE